MSIKKKIPCNQEVKEIGVFNRIDVLSIPIGVTLSISFVETPRENQLFPLTEYVADKDADGNYIEKARRCFLHINGVSADFIELVVSNVTPESGYVEIQQARELVLESSTKIALENSNFSPIGADAIEVEITPSNSYTLEKGTKKVIQFHSTHAVGVEIDSNGIKYPMYEQRIPLDNIVTDIKFHNDSVVNTVALIIWSM